MAQNKKQKVQNVEFTLNAKQTIAFKSLNDRNITEVCYGGGAGSGKSMLGCAWILGLAINNPGTRYLIGRHQLNVLKTTTLKTLLEILQQKWKVNPKFYKFNQQDFILTFANGSEILFKELAHKQSDSDYSRFGGLELTAAFIDEANQISFQAYNIIKSRIRYKLSEFNLTPKILITCNPNRGWIYENFFRPYENNSLPSDRVFIPALVQDNPDIDSSYIPTLEKLDEISKQRLLYGNWNFTDDLTLFDLDAVYSLYEGEREYDFSGQTEYYLSVDGARLGKDSSVIMVWQNMNVIDCITLKGTTVDIPLEKVKHLQLIHNVPVQNIVIDSDGNGSWADFLPGCYKFVNNASAINGENYRNVRAQLYYLLAKNVNERRIKFYPTNLEYKNLLTQDLMNIKAKNIDRDMKRQIISKEEIKQANGGRSTDFSDAMMMRMIYELKETKTGSTPPSYEYLVRVHSLKRK